MLKRFNQDLLMKAIFETGLSVQESISDTILCGKGLNNIILGFEEILKEKELRFTALLCYDSLSQVILGAMLNRVGHPIKGLISDGEQLTGKVSNNELIIVIGISYVPEIKSQIKARLIIFGGDNPASTYSLLSINQIKTEQNIILS